MQPGLAHFETITACPSGRDLTNDILLPSLILIDVEVQQNRRDFILDLLGFPQEDV